MGARQWQEKHNLVSHVIIRQQKRERWDDVVMTDMVVRGSGVLRLYDKLKIADTNKILYLLTDTYYVNKEGEGTFTF